MSEYFPEKLEMFVTEPAILVAEHCLSYPEEALICCGCGIKKSMADSIFIVFTHSDMYYHIFCKNCMSYLNTLSNEHGKFIMHDLRLNEHKTKFCYRDLI